jgi:hypothetical protein
MQHALCGESGVTWGMALKLLWQHKLHRVFYQFAAKD